MKKLLSFLLFVLTGWLAVAQTAPYPGATWYFQATYIPPSMSSMADRWEKWEYIGDSSAADGIYRRMHITAENLYHPPGGVDVTEWDANFRYSGDTITRSGFLIANFAVALGDTMRTPYYQFTNLYALAGDCDSIDSATVLQYGTVTDVGIDLIDGVPARAYTLTFNDELGNQIEWHYNERTVLESHYWWRLFTGMCDNAVEGPIMEFRCYEDDSLSTTCVDEAYVFEHLGLPSEEIIALTVYPNPAISELVVKNPSTVVLSAEMLDLSGRTVKSNVVLEPGTTTIGLSELAPGVYVLCAGGARNCFVKR